MKNACMTRQTLLMFPHMKHLTEDSTLAASAVASGMSPDEATTTFSMIGRGAFTQAYGSNKYVVKGTKAGHQDAENTAVWSYRKWFRNTYKARHTSKLFKQMCKNILAPTVVLFDCVVVQEKVKYIGNKFSLDLCYAVEDLAHLLGITDMHGANWGVTETGEVKIFDIMPFIGFAKGKPFTNDAALQAAWDEVQTLARREFPQVHKKHRA